MFLVLGVKSGSFFFVFFHFEISDYNLKYTLNLSLTSDLPRNRLNWIPGSFNCYTCAIF